MIKAPPTIPPAIAPAFELLFEVGVDNELLIEVEVDNELLFEVEVNDELPHAPGVMLDCEARLVDMGVIEVVPVTSGKPRQR